MMTKIKKADAVFDIEDNKFIKRPEDFNLIKIFILKTLKRKYKS